MILSNPLNNSWFWQILYFILFDIIEQYNVAKSWPGFGELAQNKASFLKVPIYVKV